MFLSGRRDRGIRRSGAHVLRLVFTLAVALASARLAAQVNVTVNANLPVAVMPDIGIGLNTSVYANIFGDPALPGEIADAGVQMLRYPGGNYASIYHWSNHTATPDGYAASASHFGNFVRLLMDGSGAKGTVTINYGSSHQATLPGQPKEAAAWVAYANGDASIYNTDDDITIGVDAEGNDWRTVGYWANLRTLTPQQNPDNQYDFLAIDRDEPIGIEYWEIGNELNGNGYYSDYDANWNWQYDLNAPNPYGPGRGNHPGLSPTTYANNFNEFAVAMKAVDPTIKVGAVLVGPGGVGDVADPSRNWDSNVLPIAGPNMDFGIYHWYACCNTGQILGAVDDLPGIYDEIRDRIDTYVGPGASENIEIHVTELGYFNGPLSATNDGVFIANALATSLASGVKSVQWHELSKDPFLGDTFGNLTRGGAYYGTQVFSQIAEPGSDFVLTTSSSGNIEVSSLVLPDGRVGMLIANLNSSGSASVNINIDNIELDVSGTSWLYGSTQSTPLETVLTAGLGNSFAVNVPFRSILALLINAPPSLPGDFNDDGIVDAADYTRWRDNLGGDEVALNGNGDGMNGVDEGDFALWQANFGMTLDNGAAAIGSAAANATVPEPAAGLLVSVSALGLFAHRRTRRAAICG